MKPKLSRERIARAVGPSFATGDFLISTMAKDEALYAAVMSACAIAAACNYDRDELIGVVDHVLALHAEGLAKMKEKAS